MAQRTTAGDPIYPVSNTPPLFSLAGLRYRLSRPAVREALSAYLFLTPFFIFFFVFVLRSIVFSGYMSLHDWKVLSPVQRFVGLQNYNELMTDSVWWGALRTTAYFAAFTVIGTVILSLGVALLLRRNIRGGSFFRAAFFAP